MRAHKVSERLESVVQRHGGRIVRCGLVLPTNLSLKALKDIAGALITADQRSAWDWGDWWRRSEHRHGERMELVNSEHWQGLAYQTLANRGSVAEAFSQISRRRYNLSFTHHATVASLPPAEADKILAEAAAHSHPVRWVEATARPYHYHATRAAGLEALAIRDGTPTQPNRNNTHTITETRAPTINRTEEKVVPIHLHKAAALSAQTARWSQRSHMAEDGSERAIGQVTAAVRDVLRTRLMTPSMAMASLTAIVDQILDADTIDALLRAKLERLRQALSGDASDVEEPAA